jgi:hypothetical protein
MITTPSVTHRNARARSSPAPAPAAPPPLPAASADRIRARAYQIYEARSTNGTQGDAVSDWLQAEHEVYGASPDPWTLTEIEARARSRGETLLRGGK